MFILKLKSFLYESEFELADIGYSGRKALAPSSEPVEAKLLNSEFSATNETFLDAQHNYKQVF